MQNQYFIVSKIDKVKSFDPPLADFCHIDVNSWFKSNNLSPQGMNEIRQFIFEEWLCKKISSSKSKVSSGSNLVVIYENPNEPFINLLRQKISDIFECENCDVILIEE